MTRCRWPGWSPPTWCGRATPSSRPTTGRRRWPPPAPSDPDLIVLDVMLPGFDGIEVCRQVRTFTDAYIIMLTARDEEIDKVVALSTGADDYLVKPFSPRELIARVKAMLRRPRTPAASAPGAAVEPEPALTFADLALDSGDIFSYIHANKRDAEDKFPGEDASGECLP